MYRNDPECLHTQRRLYLFQTNDADTQSCTIKTPPPRSVSFKDITVLILPLNPCAVNSHVRNPEMLHDTFMLVFTLKVFVIYTCSTNSGASIFYLEHLFFIRGECCVTQRYCCFGSAEVFGENITLDPFTCIWLAEGLDWGNRLIFIFGLSCGAPFPCCEFKI